MRAGVYQVAFLGEIKEGLTPLDIGDFRLMTARAAGRIVVADATCPHFGANLAHGGALEGEAVRCPFHHKLIGIGCSKESDLCVRTHRSSIAAGAIYVSIGDAGDLGLLDELRRVEELRPVVSSFSLVVRAQTEWVIGNGFDEAHFMPVHRVLGQVRLKVLDNGHSGPFVATGMFRLPASEWQVSSGARAVEVPYRATAYSPGIVLSHMGGEFPYWVLTAATPKGDGTTRVFITVLVPPGKEAGAPDANRIRYLLNGVRAGLAPDIAIWQHMVPGFRPALTGDDVALASFLTFCERFPKASADA